MKREYMVVHCQSIAELEIAVDNYLNGGWQLAGGVAVTHINDPIDRNDSWHLTFSQALTRDLADAE